MNILLWFLIGLIATFVSFTLFWIITDYIETRRFIKDQRKHYQHGDMKGKK